MARVKIKSNPYDKKIFFEKFDESGQYWKTISYQENQNKGKGNQGAEKQNQKSEPQNPNDPNKIPKDLQKLILQRSANQERETAKKLLNKNGYYSPESNTKDW